MAYVITREIGDRGCTVTETYRSREFNDLIDDYIYSGLQSVCYECPAVEAVPEVPAVTTVDPQYGWNSSAYSTTARAGDCYTQFTVPSVVGVVCGLAPERRSNHPRDIPHGFYCYKGTGGDLWSVVEAGATRTAPTVRDPAGSVFRVERRRGLVQYFHNNALVYTSAQATTESLVVVACMYSAGDGVN